MVLGPFNSAEHAGMSIWDVAPTQCCTPQGDTPSAQCLSFPICPEGEMEYPADPWH